MSDDTFLYLETRGRKSGQPRKIEIWFVEHAGRYYLCAEMRERAQWVQNVRAHAAVTFSVGTRGDEGARVPKTAAHARVLDPARDSELIAKVGAVFDTKYDWSDGTLVEIAPS